MLLYFFKVWEKFSFEQTGILGGIYAKSPLYPNVIKLREKVKVYEKLNALTCATAHPLSLRLRLRRGSIMKYIVFLRFIKHIISIQRKRQFPRVT
jgi:hypothetical protein